MWPFFKASIVALASLALIGCGDEASDLEKTRDDLVQSGVPEPVADCIVDGIGAEFSDDDQRRFSSEGIDGEGELQDRFRRLVISCADS